MNLKEQKMMQSSEESIASVSIVCENCMIGDAVATTAMTFSSVKESKEWIESVRLKYSIFSYYIYSRKEGLVFSPPDPLYYGQRNVNYCFFFFLFYFILFLFYFLFFEFFK